MEMFPNSTIPTIPSLPMSFKEQKQVHVKNVLNNYVAEYPKNATNASLGMPKL
jgi:hypothetical protein